MSSRKTQKAALITREAHLALLDLKKLVDSATEKTHQAELETEGQVIGTSRGEDALATLRGVAQAIGSPDFDAVLSQARMKIENAVASHLTVEEL